MGRIIINFQEMNLFVEKNGTVGHVLEEAKKEFPYSENGTGQLRYDLLFYYRRFAKPNFPVISN